MGLFLGDDHRLVMARESVGSGFVTGEFSGTVVSVYFCVISKARMPKPIWDPFDASGFRNTFHLLVEIA